MCVLCELTKVIFIRKTGIKCSYQNFLVNKYFFCVFLLSIKAVTNLIFIQETMLIKTMLVGQKQNMAKTIDLPGYMPLIN